MHYPSFSPCILPQPHLYPTRLDRCLNPNHTTDLIVEIVVVGFNSRRRTCGWRGSSICSRGSARCCWSACGRVAKAAMGRRGDGKKKIGQRKRTLV